MEVEELSVAPADDCRLVLGSSQNAAGTASALAVTADNPGVHVKRFCRCTHQRPPYTDAEMGESGFIQELRVKERNYKLMAVVLTVACIINLAVTGIGVAYLRLHFAQEDILSADSALPDSPHGRDQEAIYRHYYRYYRKRVAPKVDIRVVLAVTITVISAVQEEIKEEEENTLKRILEEQVDIRGGYSKPTVRHVLWVQLVLLPYTIGSYLWWQARWLFKFTLGGQELGLPEKQYLIRRHMALSQSQWDALEEKDRQGFLRDELWISDKFKVPTLFLLAFG
ncbi:hypothetical protein V5799_026403 [Amblyomma americanum]|uniref:Uncharacterized protein n=1 Tax=Amblyomma americanum TaxID=6943 RepID=A0AAQ4DIP5_AMBAM